VWSVWPLVDVVAGLELSGIGLGQDVDAFEPLHGGHGVPVRHDDAERGSVVGTEGLAIHRVGDEDPGPSFGRVRQRECADEAEVVPVGVGEDRGEVVSPVVGALEPDVDAARLWGRQRQDVVQGDAGPAGGGDRVVTPRFAGR